MVKGKAALLKGSSQTSEQAGPLVWLFSKLVKLFSIAFIIVVILLGGIALYTNYQAGAGATAVAHAGAITDNTAFPTLYKILGAETYKAIFRPQVTYGFESDIDSSQTKEVGIKEMSLNQIGRAEYGRPVQVLGRFTASSPLADLDLVVQCQLEDEKPVDAVLSSFSAVGNTARIFKGSKEVVTAGCVFPAGLIPEEKTFVTGFELSTSSLKKELPITTAGKVKMMIRYTFNSKASHKTYLLSRDVARKILLKDPEKDSPLKIFEYFGVKDTQLQSDGRLRSLATPGPLNLGIGTYSSQPFVEKTPYAFAVTLTNNFGEWRGELKKLNSLDLLIPPDIRLEGDEDFGSSVENFAGSSVSSCHFVYAGEGDNGFRLYSLKDEELEKVNKECSKEVLQSNSLTEKECIDIFGKDKDIIFNCAFKENNAYPRLTFDFIRAEANYIYQTSQSAVVKAYRPIG